MVKETDKSIRVSWYLNTAFIGKTILSSEWFHERISYHHKCHVMQKVLEIWFQRHGTRAKDIYFVDFFYWKVFNCSILPFSVLFKRLTKLVATPILEHDFKMHCVSADSLSSDKESSYKSDTERLPANYARKPVSIFLKE